MSSFVDVPYRHERDWVAVRIRVRAALLPGTFATGVANYAWESCWRDYRRAVVEQLLVAMQWYHVGLPDALWLQFVPRALTAYRDLTCEEFLEE
jgi:hypothetical protein